MGQDLILKAIERELRLLKLVQKVKGNTHKDTITQLQEVDKLLSIGGLK